MKDKKSLFMVDDDIAHRTMLRILLEGQSEIFEADIYYPSENGTTRKSE